MTSSSQFFPHLLPSLRLHLYLLMLHLVFFLSFKSSLFFFLFPKVWSKLHIFFPFYFQSLSQHVWLPFFFPSILSSFLSYILDSFLPSYLLSLLPSFIFPDFLHFFLTPFASFFLPSFLSFFFYFITFSSFPFLPTILQLISSFPSTPLLSPSPHTYFHSSLLPSHPSVILTAFPLSFLPFHSSCLPLSVPSYTTFFQVFLPSFLPSLTSFIQIFFPIFLPSSMPHIIPTFLSSFLHFLPS